MGATAGTGGSVEVEGGYGGLMGWPAPAWGGLVADGDDYRRRLGRARGNTEALGVGTGMLFGDQVGDALATLMVAKSSPTLLALPPRPRWLDRQGFSTLLAAASDFVHHQLRR